MAELGATTEVDSKKSPKRVRPKRTAEDIRFAKAMKLLRSDPGFVAHAQAAEAAYRANKGPDAINQQEKVKIGNIVAQKLHIQSAEQFEKFVSRYSDAFKAMSELAGKTGVIPKEPGKRIRPGHMALVKMAARASR